jgi:hypothetical protein
MLDCRAGPQGKYREKRDSEPIRHRNSIGKWLFLQDTTDQIP